MKYQTALKEDTFLGQILGVTAWVLDAQSAEVPSFGPAPCFVSAKVPSSDLRAIRLLEDRGFRFAEVNLLFAAASGSISAVPAMEIREARDSDEEQVSHIAGKAFVQSRFSLDPEISRECAERIKNEWVRNFFRKKRGEALFIAEVEGEVAGFLLALLSQDQQTATIDLIATADSQRRAGVGKSLVAAFSRKYHFVKMLRVGTQASNIASVRFYETLGFRLESSSAVMHLHYRAGSGK